MIWRAALDLVLPPRCVFCGSQSVDRNICVGCDADLPRIESPPPLLTSPFVAEVAPLAYDFPVDAAIKALKFKRKLYYVPALTDLLSDACHRLPTGIDAVLPVPLHWRRRWVRGFNQAEELARPVARRLDVPMIYDVVRYRATEYQSGLSATARNRNLRNAFRVRSPLSYGHVLIVDDVITTGATLRQVASQLMSAGVKKVSVLAIARAKA